MKNKILAIAVAAGSAILGSSLISTPAQAQLSVTSDPIAVEIDVPEVLFLRTFDAISLTLDDADLGGVTTAGVGKDFDNVNGTTDGTTTIDRTSPFGTIDAIEKDVEELYAVWSNNPDGGVDVTFNINNGTLNGANGGTAIINLVKAYNPDPASAATAPGLADPFVGGATIEFDLSNATQAGLYTGGSITVTATAP
ncbi:hypothetical protein [Fischerella thermalis]|uniref:hypothetical protein n=1 Tax=Fischerella thermalis TaxID=372787 RepID=UPI0019D814E2|nr:hypothetical protein [Fischerella thermalis]MBF1987959.1 hypothetical protein [Fischerella thermalis M58_A2018_009]MBF2059621.1 hypothetical protein [Fischerella thermalis M66_A2018_004]MBF2069259.1 hypothetical protein [Fischerella thermalis M48_A2018_028]